MKNNFEYNDILVYETTKKKITGFYDDDEGTKIYLITLNGEIIVPRKSCRFATKTEINKYNSLMETKWGKEAPIVCAMIGVPSKDWPVNKTKNLHE